MDRDRRRSQGGYAVVWVVVAIALIVLGFAGYMWAHGKEVDATFMVVCGALCVVGLAVEARRDLYEFCQFSFFFGLVAAVGCGAVAIWKEGTHPIAAASAIVFGLGTLACAAHLIAAALRKELLPNLLKERGMAHVASEIDGVQFASWASDTKLAAGEQFTVCVLAQNCHTAERVLEIRLDGRARFGKKGDVFAYDKDASITLPGGGAGVLTIPVSVSPAAKGPFRLGLAPKVRGRGGKRLRQWRARPFSGRTSDALKLLMLFGVFMYGGGIEIPIEIVGQDGADPADSDVAPCRVEMLFELQPAELAHLERQLN